MHRLSHFPIILKVPPTIVLILLFIIFGIMYSANYSEASEGEPTRGAMYYEKLSDNNVKCTLCFRNCIIPEGKRGYCNVRENRDGNLFSLVYSRPSSFRIEPVEKEPLHHFLPGSMILCIGTAGCNYRCRFCHNWQLSQSKPEDIRYYLFTPEVAVRQVIENDVPSISFTYNEPTVFYEYIYETAKLAKKNDIRIVIHSNGAMNPEPLKRLLPYTDAFVIDLKGFCNDYYRRFTDAELAPVLQNLKIIKESGVWLEIVNLVVTGQNDDPKTIRNMCKWIIENLGPEVPLHFSRFFPSHRLRDLSPTPVRTLEKAYAIAKDEGLHYISIGNVPGHKRNSTYCHLCGSILISRHHFTVRHNNLINSKCKNCEKPIPGIWE